MLQPIWTPGKEIVELNAVLRQRDAKLAEAQQAQAGSSVSNAISMTPSVRCDLTIENRVQAELAAVRDKAKQDAEQALISGCGRKKSRSPRCSVK